MSTYTETVSNKLNDLLEKTYDAEKGFKQAAENVEHTALKNFFERKSSERYNFGHEIKDEIKAFGHEVDKGDSLTSKAHRAWMDLKSFFSSDDSEAMLEEVIRGEKAAIEEYNDVLSETTLPPSTAQLLTKQRNTIQEGLTVISNLELAS